MNALLILAGLAVIAGSPGLAFLIVCIWLCVKEST
jgi:hypothetical protein